MKKQQLYRNLQQNIELIQNSLSNTDELITREFTLNLKNTKKDCVLFYLEAMASGDTINSEILRPLLLTASEFSDPFDRSLLTFLRTSVVTAGDIKETSDLDQILLSIMSGGVVLFVDGIKGALSIDVKGFVRRAVTHSQSEALIRGPRDSFTETLSDNISLIRRRLRDPSLVIKRFRIGLRGQTDIAITYIEGLAKQDLIDEIMRRINAIKVDLVLESGYVEQLIEDDWRSPFNTLQDTERPDEVVAGIIEGRVAILFDNTPHVLLAPTTFNSQMLSPEDYYVRWLPANFVRIIRFMASFIALIAPSLYIALTAYHPEMLPTQLALSIAGSRSGVPFPIFIEALIMELSLELLREAGIRLPSPIGQTIGIVGGLVIGEAAVRAQLVSPIMVIVVALTAIASFIIPTYTLGFGLRITRFFLMLTASFLGLYGLSLGLLIILGHLATLESFGVSYLSPWAPFNFHDLKDSIYRSPWHKFKLRPEYTQSEDPTRQPEYKGRKRKGAKNKP